MAIKFRKGELVFYKGMLPKEFKQYEKEHPENKEYIDEFLNTYIYDYVKKKWEKRDEFKSVMDRFKKD